MSVDTQMFFAFQPLERDFTTERCVAYLHYLTMLATASGAPIDLVQFGAELESMGRIVNDEAAFRVSKMSRLSSINTVPKRPNSISDDGGASE